jgi:tetratricopeptide (TPR) repeat protein
MLPAMRNVVAVGIAVVLGLVVAPRPARACLWDYDTFKEEALRDKDVAQVVRGELQKHSAAFYAAKVTYTQALVDAGTASKERYDDLAVALARGGKHDDALAVLDAKDKKFPGEYTTEANRGAILAMKGDFQGSLERTKAAIAINPDAHFGREHVQVKLLEYALRLADKDLPKNENFLGLAMTHDVLIKGSSRSRKRDKELDKTIKGMVGMIRYGEAQGIPHIWFALGWALATQGDNQLAARAFRRAEVLGHPRAGFDGATISTILRKNNPSTPCCPDADSPELQKTWAKAAAVYDAEWAKSEAKDAKAQATEDKKIARKQWKKLFGY